MDKRYGRELFLYKAYHVGRRIRGGYRWSSRSYITKDCSSSSYSVSNSLRHEQDLV